MREFSGKVHNSLDGLAYLIEDMKNAKPDEQGKVADLLGQIQSEVKELESNVNDEVDWDADPSLPDPSSM